MYGSCDFSVLKLFEDVRGVGRVNIEGSLGDGRYAHWLTRVMEMPFGHDPPPYNENLRSWDAWQGNR